MYRVTPSQGAAGIYVFHSYEVSFIHIRSGLGRDNDSTGVGTPNTNEKPMGIIVLGVLLVYILLSIGLMAGAQYLGKRKGWKWSRWWTVGLVMLLIPTWDIPIGWVYFKYLCETQAGMFVHEKVKLSDEYFLDPGERNPRYQSTSRHAYARGGELDVIRIKKDYDIRSNLDRDYAILGSIHELRTTIRDDRGEVIAVAVSYFFRGGWLSKPLLGGRSGKTVCPRAGMPGSKGDIHEGVIDSAFER